jgi:hypothetical protein
MPRNPSNLKNIDRVIHEPTRLMIMTQLYVIESADFLFLQHQLEMTPSKLEKVGYVEIVKEFIERKPHTALKLTKKGRSAFKEYQQNLRQVFSDLSK